VPVRQPSESSRPDTQCRQPAPHALVSDAHVARQFAPLTRHRSPEFPAQKSGCTSQAIQRVSNALSVPDAFSAMPALPRVNRLEPSGAAPLILRVEPRSGLRGAPGVPRPLSQPKIFLMVTERGASRRSLRRHGRQFKRCGGLPVRTRAEAASRCYRPPTPRPKRCPTRRSNHRPRRILRLGEPNHSNARWRPHCRQSTGCRDRSPRYR
jgi:hypothetical protein